MEGSFAILRARLDVETFNAKMKPAWSQPRFMGA